MAWRSVINDNNNIKRGIKESEKHSVINGSEKQ